MADTKKKPGRPRKAALAVQVNRRGIVGEPSEKANSQNAEIILELAYDSPALFKKIFAAIKHLGANEAHIHFDTKCMKIHCVDHIGTTRMYCIIYGKEMMKYYCEADYNIVVNPNEFQNVFGNINAAHEVIRLTTIRTNRYKKLTTTLVNEREGVDTDYNVNIDRSEFVWPVNLPSEITYDLRFELSAKSFKKLIAGTMTVANSLTITKNGGAPLQFTFDFSSTNGDGAHTFPDGTKIGLISSVGETDLLMVSVPLNYLAPVSAINLADKIKIAVKKDEDIISTFLMDCKVDANNKYVDDSHSCYVKLITRRA